MSTADMRYLVIFACVALVAAATAYISWSSNRAAADRWTQCSDLIANAKGGAQAPRPPRPVYRQDIVACVAELPEGRLKAEAQALLDAGFDKVQFH